MSNLEHLKTWLGRFNEMQDLNFAASPSDHPHLSLSGIFQPEINTGVQFLIPMMGQSEKAWTFGPLKSRGGTKTVQDDDSDGHGGKVGKRAVSLSVNDADEPNRSCNGGKSGRTKFCARGHWRPTEDAKLKELVVQFGPRNWNLIAENLEGRSGNLENWRVSYHEKVRIINFTFQSAFFF